MKTKQLFLLGFLGLTIQLSNAQATTASTTNTVTSTAYLGSGSTSNFDVIFKRNAVPAGILATTKTSFGVNSAAMPNSVSFGVGAGQFSSGTGYNTYIGQNAGKGQSSSITNSGSRNTFVGNGTGTNNSTGNYNSYFGDTAGSQVANAYANCFFGVGAGDGSSGGQNLYFGAWTGNTAIGSSNICIGFDNSESLIGSNNIIIGNLMDFSADNKLIIENNADFNNPLIWGDFASNQLKLNCKTGIGSNFGNYPTTAGSVNVSGYNLFVKGGILTEEVRISLASTWADYVFKKGYNLKPLKEVEKYIIDNGHLPNVPSAKTVKEDGIELGEMAKIQQEKIEELTLYVIELSKKLEAQEKKIEALMQNK